MISSYDKQRFMRHKIREVLLVSSAYDLYIMEEEGFLGDRISDDYALLHLTNAPVITRVSTANEALEAIRQAKFDLVVTGLRVGKGMNVFEMASQIKKIHPKLPIALLTSETGRLPSLEKRRDRANIDKIFFWHGDARLFLAIIKSFEDIANAGHDCLKENVRVIILVEDSPDFYSSYLPLIYTEILEQIRALIAEGASDEEKIIRMASRPKILMAENYEQAIELYERYSETVLGVITDMRFPRDGVVDPEAGFKLTEHIREDKRDIPVLIQSKNKEKAYRAAELGASFVDKNSPHLLQELRTFVLDYIGFGSFIFRMPDGKEVGRAKSKREMEQVLRNIPAESIRYHGSRNHFSHWLFARGEFELAAKLRPLQIDDFSSVEEIRNILIEGLEAARRKRRKARINQFSEQDFDLSTPFVRFGEGSIGGKGRGIAFMSKLLSESKFADRLSEFNIFVPPTAAIGTDVFDRFLERNHLQKIAMEETSDATIARAFLEAELGSKIVGQLAAFLKRVTRPLAVRSSSLSEDSLSQPFAGLYSTYLIPNNHRNFEERLRQFLSAIKLVYASTFYTNPKAYMEANGIAVEGEKMAVVIQQIAGYEHGDYFYPDVGGVAQSYNYFPVGYLKPEDGVAQIVMGLGTMAMRGEKSLRFCPKFPNILPQYSKPADIVKNSQREFHAVNLSNSEKPLSIDEERTLTTLKLEDARDHDTLAKLAAVYCDEDNMVYEGIQRPGKLVLTFQRLLSGAAFNFPKALSTVLDLGASGMGCPIEIEFAANLARGDKPASFAFLQIRPLVTGEEASEVNVEGIDRTSCLAISDKAMGNGVFDQLTNLIYVKPDTFDLSRTVEIAAEIGKLNSTMIGNGESYILLGFGRWGTANPLLGIPVAYAQVSHSKVICEISTKELNVEPSQGTHFFHNIASCRIGYLSIDLTDEGNLLDWKWLNDQPAVAEMEFVRLIRSKKPIVTRIDGRSGRGVIQKP